LSGKDSGSFAICCLTFWPSGRMFFHYAWYVLSVILLLRMLFMQAARVILLRSANWLKHGFSVWLVRAAQRYILTFWLRPSPDRAGEVAPRERC
jgi:hypothetical protein